MILSHPSRPSRAPLLSGQGDFILDTRIPQIGEILKGAAASPDVLASVGRPIRFRDGGEEISLNGDCGHLEGDIAAVADHLRQP